MWLIVTHNDSTFGYGKMRVNRYIEPIITNFEIATLEGNQIRNLMNILIVNKNATKSISRK